MRCLVTGATGHIGPHLVKYLLERSVEVAALVRPTSNLWRIEDVLHHLYIIRGFWACMDPYRDFLSLNDLWKDKAPWKV